MTACPGSKLYALLPEIRDQVSENLTTTTLISARVPSPKPTIPRGIVVAGRWYSDKTTDTFMLPIRWAGVTSCTSSDSTITINSCQSNNNQLAISLTRK